MELEGAAIRNIFTLCTEVKEGSNTKIKTRLRVNIPHYQRPYTWENEQIKNLIGDFHQYNDDPTSKSSYFAGSIVAVNKDGIYDIVDGQQRITTVYLIAYLKFLIQRAYTEEIIKTRIATQVVDSIKKLKEIYKDLIGESLFLENFQSKITKIEKISQLTEDQLKEEYREYKELINSRELVSNLREDITKKEFEKFEEYYRTQVGLPMIKDLKNNYPELHKESMSSFLKKENLYLKYSRNSLNEKLKDALSRVCIELSSVNSIEIKTVKKEIENQNSDIKEDTINKYIESIELIFNKFKEYSQLQNKDFLQDSDEIVKLMNHFLEHLQFCVVATGNDNDAYTLFEVLNDRALAVSDLDLIKNLFYKTYVLKSGDEDRDIDNNLSVLERKWSDDIFGDSTVLKSKNTIAYLATVFITGNSSIDDKHLSNYRKDIEVNHLEKIERYGFLDIQKDFNVFQSVKVILNESEIAYRNSKKTALIKEDSGEISATIKAIHLTHALKQYGVMSALTNIILKTFIDEYNQKDEIDIEKFKEFVNKLNLIKHSEEHPYKSINNFSYELTKIVLLSKNYELPRKFAKGVIENVNYKKRDTKNCLDIRSKDENTMIEEFLDWTNQWYYNSNTDFDFKIKMLFLKLYKTKKDGCSLEISRSTKIFNKDSLELEHLEPKNIDDSSKENYFMYEDKDERLDYVNRLGNILLSYKKENIEKSDTPIYEGLKHYDSMDISSHWLLKEIKEMLEDKKYSELNSLSRYIPKENFFTNRRIRLQKYFISVLKLNLDNKKSKII